MSRATAEQLERHHTPGNARHSRFARLRREHKRLASRIRRREERDFCKGCGPEPRPRHIGGWVY